MHTGKVVIAGAGPGDPELLTLKTARYLHMAEVVLTDRLVSEQILQRYVNPVAEIIFVGKEGGENKSIAQKTINKLLVQYAQEGKFIVRLKGGDISVFSNILDELETLRAHNIPYELVPGITAASGAAAYAGIPLTARDNARAVRFLTYQKTDILSAAHWQDLADTDDTLVFYMSGETLNDLVQHLSLHGISGKKSVAVIEQATTPYQRVFTRKFSDLNSQILRRGFVSPTLLIIGNVVNLHQSFRWLANSKISKSYFRAAGENQPVQQYSLSSLI
ncbi:uroporphyrinogen-III C-methyltransferase [Taibaiella soli]|uniref:uroporphyrinogen-III C-methyltransferase n=1 Tax=Taibaiella soli TaxID=1649169 RepID=A0A2W2B621_9BACT|nr:uroporphyrinogen-III C-methyltransferase [Taibaiella soli]PZF71659.1 uroporphyrinogen-III C-methyltransferase [Taibaiella soli]